MPTPDTLFELIKSLDKNEKRHFKIYAKRHVLHEENQYMRLFDVVDRLETYDEADVKAQLGRSKFARNLASGKNYLYNLILKSLRTYHAGKSVKVQLQELWLDINLLIEKGLLRQAMKLIRKAKKLADQYQYDIQLLEIALLERKLIRRYTSNKADALIQTCQEESAACLERLQLQFGILDLYETVFISYRNDKDSREPLDAVMAQVDQLVPDGHFKNLSFEALNNYHLLHLHHANKRRDYSTGNRHLQALIAMHEANPFLIDEEQERYINHLNNYLNNCLALDRLEEFPPVLRKMKSVNAKNFKLKGLIFNNVFYLEMLYHLVREEYQAVIRMVPEIERGLKKYGEGITKSRELTFYCNISIAFFMEKDYPQALDWINRILSEPKLEERQDIQTLARIFEIVLHYELGNEELVESLIGSVDRYLRKKNKRQSAEYLVAKKLKQALYADKKKREVVFQELAEELQPKKGLDEIKVWVREKTKKSPAMRSSQSL